MSNRSFTHSALEVWFTELSSKTLIWVDNQQTAWNWNVLNDIIFLLLSAEVSYWLECNEDKHNRDVNKLDKEPRIRLIRLAETESTGVTIGSDCAIGSDCEVIVRYMGLLTEYIWVHCTDWGSCKDGIVTGSVLDEDSCFPLICVKTLLNFIDRFV